MKVKILKQVRLEIDGKAVDFEIGEAEMPDALVDSCVAGGYAELIKDKPSVKVVNKPNMTEKKAVK